MCSSDLVNFEPISSGRYVTFFAYSGQNRISSINYKSESAGSVTPVAGSGMVLPNGTYTFYGAGTNSTSDQTPTFSGSTATSLSNGIDYLAWQYSTPVSITSSKDFIVKFEHACTQIVIKLDTAGTDKTGSNIKVELVSVECTPSSIDGVSWDLISGVITPATSLSSAVQLGMTGNYAQYIMRPLEGNLVLDFTFKLSFNGVEQTIPFTGSQPIPSGALKAGNSYLFLIEIQDSEINFTNVDVINWVEVSGGAPIIPIQL